MKKEGHLEVYDLTLTTHSPLHIGQGTSYKKKEYCFDSRTSLVSFLNQKKFFDLLVNRNLVDKYEAFILGNDQNLYAFLKYECGLSSQEIREITQYRVDASLALDDRHSLKEIFGFLRNPKGSVYIPGSSVKGAIRTVILTDMIMKDAKKTEEIRNHSSTDKFGNIRTEKVEGEYLHTLRCKTKEDHPVNDAVNSIMRGITISDSLPVSDDAMILCTKLDSSVKGRVKKIPLCRECIRPGTEIRFKLTLDTSVLKDAITVSTIQEMLTRYDDTYWNTYITKFAAPEYDSGEEYENAIILGGGSGFFSKTFAYPFYGDKALIEVRRRMEKRFRDHNHNSDSVISPRTLKYTEYDGQYYPYGVCEVQIH